MNLKNSLHRPFFVLSLLGMLTLGQLTAQSSLSTSQYPTRIDYQSGTDYTDYIIPNVGGSISFTLNGGDGGRRRVPDLCTRKGGQGATVHTTFFIGTGAGQLAPGGRLRFIPGEQGKVRVVTALMAPVAVVDLVCSILLPRISVVPSQTPSLDFADASTSWVILAVAGGGVAPG
ncbi:MAG: hypothetical protein H6566_15850 [Lewinellaceae bacterium]|nr:hypothetical protein [Lewinellaceae bacterium]